MSQDPETPKPRRGRPPNEALYQRVIDVARDILVHDGFGRVSIEAVAERSGVSKPTIYRRWSNASELAITALMSGFPDQGNPDGSSLANGLSRQIRTLVKAFSTTRGRQIAMALASADPESEFTKAFRNRVILSSREQGRVLIEAAVERGAVHPPDDLSVVLDMIYGPIFYRLLAGHAPVDEVFGERLVASALALLGHGQTA